MAEPTTPMFAIGNTQESLHDYTSYVQELQIEREDLDSEDSGREVKTGVMDRTRIAWAHTLTVKLRTIAGNNLDNLTHDLRWHKFFWVKYLDPCSNIYVTREAYCSTINYGAQRYSKSEGKTVYQGVTFKVIEKGTSYNTPEQ